MRILLVYPRPDVNKRTRFGFSYDLLTIATVLRPYHQVTVRDYSCEDYDPQWFLDQVENGIFDLILLECDSFALKRSQNLNHGKELLSLVKSRIPSIAYGNYCYITKRNFDGADYTVQVNDINALLAQINSLSNFEIVPAIQDYDALPYVDREILLSIEFYRLNQHSTLLQTSKGCENTCVFCQRKGWQNHYVAHSDNYVLGELKTIREQGYKNVWVIDENFTFNLVRAKPLLKKIHLTSSTVGMNLFISSWTNIDQEFLELAACCNVRVISFGIESGNRGILNFYRKNINLDRAPAIIRYANSIGLFTVGNFILGAPMESEETIENTFALIRDCEFDQVNIKTLDYMIGSELYNSLCNSQKSKDHIFACAENGLTTFPLAELIKKKEYFQQTYYAEHQTKLKKKIQKFGSPYSL
jgi:uncharacterized radical SAM superfamily protein